MRLDRLMYHNDKYLILIGFDLRTGQNKDYYKIVICCFSDKNAAFRSKSTD